MSREASSSNGSRRISERWAKLVRAVESGADRRGDDPSIRGVELGRFELLDWIGGGGMGVVFRARDTILDREVALKLWKLPGEEAEAAVLHEAQCLAKLSHPNVVAIYETGKVGDDVFLAMEFVEGMDGREWFSRFSLIWEEVVDFYYAAGRGLAAAHAAGLEHSDFKPENVLLGKDQRVRVADFGVAQTLRDHIIVDDDSLSAEESAGLGTVSYMAPERLQGRRGDARSDQFSFCVTVWECLYGTRPFEGKTAAALLEAIEAGMLQVGEPVGGIPRQLRRVIAKGLSVRPADRWADMPSLLDAMARVRRQPRRRRRRLQVAAIGVGLVVGSSLATAEWIAQRAPTPVETRAQAARPTTGELERDCKRAIVLQLGHANQVIAEVVRLIEADDLDGAHARWKEAREAAWADTTTLEWESLVIAHFFAAEALALEHTKPALSIKAGRHAFETASYARAHFPTGSWAELETADILNDCLPLITRSTRLLADYTRLARSAASLGCLCHESLGYGHVDACLDARGNMDPAAHACLAKAIQGHEAEFTPYLACMVPTLEDHSSCLSAAGCVRTEVARCDIERERDASACPRLTDSVQHAFSACSG
ncbi:Serine/threonine-protein kinase PK-1 [Enhygromyxa salina]|uniref:Serine/threonine-protein kinase PK-1 n=1 Tax=Enhygromyxa salina TaxID=215803 RepID=A0A2S9XRN0_9BACT|nr:serine/threonine-protein kinase [Enhygromyxa salina]PRP95506.1 Serine/threonine-protein kinase PK-1 [Enhygromyxa salina]